MIKEDEIFKKMFKSIDVEIDPPEGTKERIYQKLCYNSYQGSFCYLSRLSWIPEKIFKLAIQLWILLYIYMTVFTPIITN
ncbi:hypothetical protein [Clostridium estertheticum]|uniref:Uncharacterized protein n=1 Tax=Clostridium estertheticum subsp. estertheticum TaxID=1552 RepID=A0A1J0GLG3_9CLOT|nr:hypothetical protein [Clostridium estertheticum]APC41734.1 hypothetical protein A7L45_17475 [Clostridium estertheticum subsp. estertheticum]MBU3073431.1 hypothetical protein [Clostridium estertheticum]MBU3163328.1 hypothetical protein [Clostridium estertheticum]MBZ9616383.1 hypothetical protein [Clostridium estertheticum subsp. laramiense]WAG72117.1 hypothetical protein LL032_13100 [Clostridium estertheticum]